MIKSELSQCWFRDDEFSRFFDSLASIKETKTASILRYIFGLLMTGSCEIKSKSGWRIFEDDYLDIHWRKFGCPIEAIGRMALQNGAKFSEVRVWARTYNGEKLLYGVFISKKRMEELAEATYFDNEGEEWTYGVIEDGKVINFMGKKVFRLGRAYFLPDTAYSHLGHPGSMWIGKKR